MSIDNKINMLSLNEFHNGGKTENGTVTVEQLYETYKKSFNQAIAEIERLSLENKELTKENKKLKSFNQKFNHPIDNKKRNRVIKLLKERYTQKEIADNVGVSVSTVARIKKEEGVKKKGLEPKS